MVLALGMDRPSILIKSHAGTKRQALNASIVNALVKLDVVFGHPFNCEFGFEGRTYLSTIQQVYILDRLYSFLESVHYKSRDTVIQDFRD